MRKLINAPADFVDEMIDGLLLAHGDQLRPVDEQRRALIRTDAPTDGRVGVVTGGGSGHLPLFLGYVGPGLCSGVAIGNVFSSPSAEAMYEATRAVDGGAGVLYLFGNYTGDRLNFSLAADLAAADGIETATVLVADDVASAPAERASDRRGIAGLVFAYKTAGAAADHGDPLPDVARIAADTAARTRTMGVGLAPAILPEAGAPSFALGDGEMEIGVGIHGEPGVRRGQLEPAADIARSLIDHIIDDAPPPESTGVAVLVNGLGSTPAEELYVLYRTAARRLETHGVHVKRCAVREFATSLEMAGASISVLWLTDQLEQLLDAPATSPLLGKVL